MTPPTPPRRLDAQRAAPLMREAFAAAGVCAASREHAVASMLETSLRGVDSHGIRLLPHYLRAVAGGRLNPEPAIAVRQRRDAAAVLDADHALGHHAGSEAMSLARQMAEERGVGAVAVANSSHFGAAAYFALPAARAGLLGLAFTNADALSRVHGAPTAFFGTNPICLCAPMAGEEPFCLDMATSRVSWNKILQHRASGQPLPEGWANDASGAGVEDAAEAATLEAIGDYKGYGLAMMVEILCGLLADGPAATELAAMFTTPLSLQRRISHFFCAMDVGAFVDVARFAGRLSAMAEQLRALGDGAVMIPGDPEKRHFAERSAAGIPLDEGLYQELVAVDPRFAEAQR